MYTGCFLNEKLITFIKEFLHTVLYYYYLLLLLYCSGIQLNSDTLYRVEREAILTKAC